MTPAGAVIKGFLESATKKKGGNVEVEVFDV